MVSLIIPTYCEEKYIGETLRYLTEHWHAPAHEIIVSDSHSPDQTLAIAKQFPNVTVVEMPATKRRGISQGRNDGAAVAKGDFLVFMDADVIIPNPDDFFKQALAKFAANPDLVAFAPRIEVEPKRALLRDRLIYFGMNHWFAFLNWAGSGIAAGEFQMVRAEAFRKTGGFNEKIRASEDVDMFQRLAKLGRTVTALELTIYHSGRHFRKAGAWRTVWKWIVNSVKLWTGRTSGEEEWETIR